MQLSVIILNYNVRYFLEQCVLSVHALETIDGEIIVIDNNSDDSCAMMEKRFQTLNSSETRIMLVFQKE
jgi:glycosyltransferase involved in cell wall biosynthesis